MAKKEVTRRGLLDRWSTIEQQDDDDDGGGGISSVPPTKHRRLRQLKEQWFSDAFKFLIYLPVESHVWCGYWDLMGPLLETFYNYFKEESHDSPLKLLWNRISGEMRNCTQCIHQHHQAQEMYGSEYEQSSISPLLDVLRTLDEDRISKHLKDLNAKIVRGEYNPTNDYGEVVSVMFEVLMFPVLLDDQLLATEFQTFIEAIDNSHELMLDGHQQYPGVYALFFSQSRRVRSIGLRLAGHMGKLRISTDLDPLQNLLKNCISILETDVVKSAMETSRPRVQLDRITVWLGMKALVGFLEPPAFEEGILDRYPIFLSIVLNHISDDSVEFSHAVNCLRLLFEKLGYKLWLRATLSPSVMRNTLLGQCFHTRNEKSHKEIFDLFQPFLQSLEALQDGEHEKQRRHFLYFLLHQVPVSSNFSNLMRKKACQTALFIILRGYRMDPPCPPFECAHMWGPALVSSLKDSSLHSSLRQPAFDLIQTIIVSDASALMSIILNGQLHPNDKAIRTNPVDSEDEDDILSGLHINEKEASCWKDFIMLHKIVSQVDGSWMCVPMLWYDVLVEIDPTVLPLTFSKAVFWALSRFSLIEAENVIEMTLSRNWLSTCGQEISYLFGWKVPSGSDDGGDGTESRNSIRTSTMCLPLVRTFKRLTAHYTVRKEQEELRKQWTWEPMMSNSLILFLVDPNDNTRQVGRLILEKVSNVRGLTDGLQFLCSSPPALLGVFLGLRHALKLVQLDSVLLNFRSLHLIFFVMGKLLKEENLTRSTGSNNLLEVSNASKFSSQGGFLRQPVSESSPTYCDGLSSTVSSTLWKNFCCLLSQAAWPSILKCLDGGKPFKDYSVSQITCARLLEVMPVVYERLPKNSNIMFESLDNVKWLHDLADWGKSSVDVVVRYWKQTMTSLLGLIKESCSNISASAINDIEKLILYDKVSIDEVSEKIERLSVSLKSEGYISSRTGFQSDDSLNRITCLAEESESLPVGETNVKVITSETGNERDDHIIVLSDEDEPDVSAHVDGLSQLWSNKSTSTDNSASAKAVGRDFNADLKEIDFTSHDDGLVVLPEVHHPPGSSQYADADTKKISPDNLGDRQAPKATVKTELTGSKRIELLSEDVVTDSFVLAKNSNLKNISDVTVSSKQSQSQVYSSKKAILDLTSARKVQPGAVKSIKSTDKVLKEVVRDSDSDSDDDDDDAWQFSFFEQPKQQLGLFSKPNTGPKRQVIQLASPVKYKAGSMRMSVGVKRFKPPSLDEWYRPILELDFFVSVGLASLPDKDQQNPKLKEVPVCFQSPDEYVQIFRPLVLEEFKAQLQSSYQEVSSAEELCCGSLSVMSVEKNDDFHVVRFVHDENKSTGLRSLLENDLILLTRQPLQNSVCEIHAVGKVERREKDNKRRLNILSIRLYLQGCSRLNRTRTLLTQRSKWYVSRLMSITPQLREFQALSSIKEIPLLPIILNPVNQPKRQHKSRTENLGKLSQPLQKLFNSSYNDSQLQAINLAIGPIDLKKDFELTLIQGPPGTGKTRTIVAIVSCLLAVSQMKGGNRLGNDGPVRSNSFGNKERISHSTAVARAWQDAALAKQLNEDAGKNNKFAGSCTRSRILICAQSNAAVDELVARISSEGLYGCDGLMYKPYLVRVGNAKTIHPDSLPFFIDTLVDKRLEETNKNLHVENMSETGADALTVIRNNLEKLVDRIRFFEAKRANLQDGNLDSKNIIEGDCEDGKVFSDVELKVKLRKLYEQKKELYANLASVQAREKKAGEEIRALRHKYRTAVLREAEIVVTTLSGCGGDLYGVCSESTSANRFNLSSENALFDAVVIDEAAQALEPATLIPLQLLKSRETKCIMVGDPKQLPATVLSNVASKYSFQCSMFERLQRAGHPVIMLTQQYRMHPEICRFPSSHFYEGKLLNGDQMRSKAAPFHETFSLGPYVFFDIVDGQELRGKNAAALSMHNECEADAAVEVLRFFKKRYPSEFSGGRIGIITPYRSQLSLLRSRFSNAFGSSTTSEMEFNTVDGFQGREVDILLLSTVRAAGSCSETPRVSSRNLGFVADVRRMNVALTRARFSLWIFGNVRTLQTNNSWAALVKDAKQRNLIVSAKKPYSNIHRFGLENKSSSGNPSNISNQLDPVDRVKAVSEPKIVNHALGRKRKYDGTESGSVCHTSEGVSPSGKDDVKYNKKRSRDGRSFPLKKEVASSEIPNSDNKVLKTAKSTSKEYQDNADNSRAQRVSAKQTNVLHADIGEAKDNEDMSHSADAGKMKKMRGRKHLKSPTGERSTETIEHDKRQQEVKDNEDMSHSADTEKMKKMRGRKHLKSPTGEMSTQTIEHDKQQQEVKVGTSSSERTSKEKKTTGASNQAEIVKDSILKRKEQREAVDALLSSALISSKRPESSHKPLSVNKNPSTKNNIPLPVRPHKPRKDQETKPRRG